MYRNILKVHQFLPSEEYIVFKKKTVQTFPFTRNYSFPRKTVPFPTIEGKGKERSWKF